MFVVAAQARPQDSDTPPHQRGQAQRPVLPFEWVFFSISLGSPHVRPCPQHVRGAKRNRTDRCHGLIYCFLPGGAETSSSSNLGFSYTCPVGEGGTTRCKEVGLATLQPCSRAALQRHRTMRRGRPLGLHRHIQRPSSRICTAANVAGLVCFAGLGAPGTGCGCASSLAAL